MTIITTTGQPVGTSDLATCIFIYRHNQALGKINLIAFNSILRFAQPNHWVHIPAALLNPGESTTANTAKHSLILSHTAAHQLSDWPEHLI